MEDDEQIEQQNIQVTVGKINKQTFTLDTRIQNVSGLFNTLLQTEGTHYELEEIEPEQFEKCIQYLEIYDYEPPSVRLPIHSNILRENLNKEDYEFIKDYDIYDRKNQKLKKLLEAAVYLQIKSLEQVCIYKISVEFYFKKDQVQYEMLKQKLKIDKELTIEKEIKYKKDYPWIQDKNLKPDNR